VSSEDFCAPRVPSLKFMQIFADDQGTFCLVLAFSFTSCNNSNAVPQFAMPKYSRLTVQLWRKFRSGDSFTRNYWIPNSTIVNVFQDSKAWRQFCDITVIWSLQKGLEQLCPTRGPVEDFVRPSLDFRCCKSILHTATCPCFDNLMRPSRGVCAT